MRQSQPACKKYLSISMMEKSAMTRKISAQMHVLLVGVLILLNAGSEISVAGQVVTGSENEVTPHVLFATYRYIYRMSLNGSNLQTLVDDPSGILAVDYHYSKDRMFWATTTLPSIKTAQLNGSNVTTLVRAGLSYPAGLAVDWINDKLYWTDRDLHRIEEYDLITSQRRVVITTGTNSTPTGLAVYPFQDQGLIYWMDRRRNVLERVALTNNARTVMRRNVICGWPLTIEHHTGKIFWSDYCTYRIESIDVNGTNYSIIVDSNYDHFVTFSYGIAKYGNMLYWTQPTQIYSVDLKPGSPITMVYSSTSSQHLRAVHVVHPSQQPPAVCVPPCLNGRCVSHGQCTCNKGWTGQNCTTDVDECAQNNGGCEHVCTNLRGSYRCSCNQGYILGLNNKSCEGAPRHPIIPTTSARIAGISTATNPQRATSIATPSTSAKIADRSSAKIAERSTATTLLRTSGIATPGTSSQVPLVVPTHVKTSSQTPDANNLQTSSLTSGSFSSSSSYTANGEISSVQFSASKTLAPTLEVISSSMLEPMQTPVPPQEGDIDLSASKTSSMLEPMQTPVLPSEGDIETRRTEIGLLVASTSVIVAAVIIVSGLLFMALLLYRYRRRTGTWAPDMYGTSSAGSSFRALNTQSPATSSGSSMDGSSSSRSSFAVYTRPPVSTPPVVTATGSASDAAETQSCHSYALKWDD